MKQSWIDGFAETIEQSVYKLLYRGPEDEIPSAIWDTIEILYKKYPKKPFIFRKRLIEHPKQLRHYQELSKDGKDDLPEYIKLTKELSLPEIAKLKSDSEKIKFPKHWTATEIMNWIKHRPKKKQTWFLVVHLPPACDYSEFKAKEKYFASAIGGSCEIEMIGSAVYITASNIQLEREYLYSFDPLPYLKKMRLPLFIGNSISGPIIVDLAVIYTLLIIGLRGSGKSTAIHQMIYTLLSLNKLTNKEYVQVAIIGPKNREFQYFEDYGAVFAHEEDEYTQLLELLDEADRQRKNKLGRCRDILEYNSIKGNWMPFIVVLDDEVDMVGEDKYCRELLLKSVKKYRSQGIYVLAATQRPSAETWVGGIKFSEFKSQFEARLAYRTADAVNSQMAIESDRAAHLPKIPGRAIFKYDSELEVQTPYFPKENDPKDRDAFYKLMNQLPKIALPYEDIQGEVYEHESFYPRPRTPARSQSAGTSRTLKMLKSGANPFT